MGTTTVTWTVTDVNGNTNTAEQLVTVNDTEAPEVACFDVEVTLDENGFASIEVEDVNGGASDNCGVVNFSLSQSTFGVEDEGVVQVILTASDAAGNSGQCTANVTVNPFIAGNNACISIPLECGATFEGSTIGAAVQSAPFCSITITSPGIWHRFTAPSDDIYAVDLCGSLFDTKVTVYRGSCEGLICVSANDDDPRPGSPCGLQSYAEFSAEAGVEYFILVHGFGSAQGTYKLNIGCPCFVDGGTIAALSPTSICVGTGSPQFINVSLTGAVGPKTLWAVTPVENQSVVAVSLNNPNFNWDTFAPGEYRLWHMSYDESVSLAGITNGNQLSGCFDLSNSINVACAVVQAGTISTSSPTTLCVGTGNAQVVNASVSGAVGPLQGWALVDSDFNILERRVSNSLFNLDGLSPGTYRIFHAAFIRPSEVAVSSASQLQGCVENSNGIQITAQDCSSSALLYSQPNPTNGPSQVAFSLAESTRANLEVYDMSGRLIRTLFNASAEAELEYRFQFDGSHLPNGVYLYRLTTDREVLVDKFMIAR